MQLAVEEDWGVTKSCPDVLRASRSLRFLAFSGKSAAESWPCKHFENFTRRSLSSISRLFERMWKLLRLGFQNWGRFQLHVVLCRRHAWISR